MAGKTNWRYKKGSKRRKLRERVLHTEYVCWLCLRPVDKTLPPHLPASPELDERVPISKLPDNMKARAATTRDNCHLVHRYCNQSKGNKILPRGAFADDPPPLDGSKYRPAKMRKGTEGIHTSLDW